MRISSRSSVVAGLALGVSLAVPGEALAASWFRKPRPVQIIPYVGYGNATRLVAKGRVLKPQKLRKTPTSAWGRFVNNIRRVTTWEVDDVPVVVQVGSVKAAGQTNDDGFYRVVVPLPASFSPAGGVVEGTVSLDPKSRYRARKVKTRFVLPTPGARFGVISDIDDTILISHVLEKMRLLRETAFGDAGTRRAFLGAPELYHALSRGPTDDERNPVFYVSGSPWNLYDVIDDAFRRLKLPTGSFVLRDLGIGKEADPLFNIKAYKRKHIARLFDFYPDLKFVLIGDSGEDDAELYAELATDARYRDRVLAICIRYVNEALEQKRRQALAALRVRVGPHFMVFGNTAAAAEHLATLGLLPPEAAERTRVSATLSGSREAKTGTRYPIVLAHGLLGFDMLGVENFGALKYFRGIREHLEKHGYRVLVTEVGPTDGVAARARHLKIGINQFTAGKVNVIAHSMGGLDARFMIAHSGMADRVASLVTVGTPHRGSSFADWGIEHLGKTAPLLDALGVGSAAFFDLSTKSCRRLNETTPNKPGVRYFSYSGTQARSCIFPSLYLSYDVIMEKEGANDGLVSQKSAQWGKYLGNLDADHLNLAGWSFPWEAKETFDAKAFYLSVAKMLKKEGF